MAFNNQAYYEDFFLNFLYKKDSFNTEEMEPLFDSIDPQLTNNVISNRTNSTSYIAKGYMEYDDKSKVIQITDAGRKKVEAAYSKKRG